MRYLIRGSNDNINCAELIILWNRVFEVISANVILTTNRRGCHQEALEFAYHGRRIHFRQLLATIWRGGKLRILALPYAITNVVLRYWEVSVQISAQNQVIVTDVYRYFPQELKWNSDTVLHVRLWMFLATFFSSFSLIV